jgi:hypothetical protein
VNASFSARTRVVVVASLLLGACVSTPLVWTKTDVGSATADAGTDLQECRRLAEDESWRMTWERRWPPPFYNPRFMPPYYAGMRPFWLDFQRSIEREEALVEFCMHSKGYRLDRLPY